MSETYWLVCHTKPRCEKKFAALMAAEKFEHYLALVVSVRRYAQQSKKFTMPLFPGYVFVRGGPARWLQILTTAGVSSIVSCGGRPAAIPHSEIEGVRRIVETTLRVEPHPFLRSGDWVRVKYGPIAGVEGILLRKKNIARLVLSVEMLGKSAAVEVDATHVERIPSRALRIELDLQTNFISVRTGGRPSLPAA